ncbi:MAG: porin, partial [Gammaproteobacteria bacterium]|nr:porin [Gammaproteobacteria bacterium]
MYARTILAVSLAVAAAGAQAADRWQTSGDIRSGYVASESRARSGATTDADSFRTRARFRVRGELGAGWHASGRVAGRLDTNQSDEEFWLRTYAPGPAGLQDGQATIDEAYLEYRTAESPWSLRVGRFQAAFGIDDIMKKSLDQNDSPNFDITWTDGVWWQWRGSDWTTHVIARHNDRRGPTGTLRRPLDFSDGDSRLGLFAAVESKTAVGPLVRRMVTLTWLPSALRSNGLADPALEDYLAMTAKAAAEWPLGEGGTKFRLGGEIGWAPDTPRREAMNSGTGDADALSWQASFNFMDVLPDHDFGIVYGRVADGWLVSSVFPPNNELLEARWVWQA